MSIKLNDNIKINAGKPSESKYLSTGNTGYSSINEVNAQIPIGERYLGLTVLIDSGATNIEHWYKEGVQDSDLIEKKFSSEQLVGDFITGATNLGYFSGNTGVQTLVLSGFPSTPVDFDGNYYSQYNWYYSDADSIIRIGSPTFGGVLRRAYVDATRTKSWIYSVSTSGWTLSNNDVTANVGNSIVQYGYSLPVYTEAEWTGFTSNGSTSIDVNGSLTTGDTLTIGNPNYRDKDNQNLNFRSIISDTPEFIKIITDENYTRFSGASSVLTATNYGGGIGVYSGQSNNNLRFRTLVQSGDTSITQKSDGSIVIYSSSNGSADAITGVTNVGTGVGVYTGTTNRNILLRTLEGSGNTTITETTGGTIVIGSSGGTEYYTGQSPAAVSVGGITSGTNISGCSFNQLWQDLLVPELFQTTVTAPSRSISLSPSTSIYEIGCVISTFDVIGGFNRGAQTPAYCGCSPYRTGAANTYCFSGTQIAGSYASTSSTLSQTVNSYTVLSGTQTWGVCVSYDAGECPVGSKGTPNSAVACCPAATTTPVTTSITGILPWFWGTSSSPTILSSDIISGNKTVANVGTSTPIIFNATTEYLWFAAPAGTTPKTKWWVCAANAGDIGGTGQLWAASCSVNVTCGTKWVSCPFDVYVTCGITTTAAGVPMCLYS